MERQATMHVYILFTSFVLINNVGSHTLDFGDASNFQALVGMECPNSNCHLILLAVITKPSLMHTQNQCLILLHMFYLLIGVVCVMLMSL
jgi:hypothetical protein